MVHGVRPQGPLAPEGRGRKTSMYRPSLRQGQKMLRVILGPKPFDLSEQLQSTPTSLPESSAAERFLRVLARLSFQQRRRARARSRATRSPSRKAVAFAFAWASGIAAANSVAVREASRPVAVRLLFKQRALTTTLRTVALHAKKPLSVVQGPSSVLPTDVVCAEPAEAAGPHLARALSRATRSASRLAVARDFACDSAAVNANSVAVMLSTDPAAVRLDPGQVTVTRTSLSVTGQPKNAPTRSQPACP